MTDAVTATVIETPKPERPNIWCRAIQNPNGFWEVAIRAEDEPIGIGAVRFLLPGTAALREYAAWVSKVRELADRTLKGKRDSNFIVDASDTLVAVALAVVAGLPKESA